MTIKSDNERHLYIVRGIPGSGRADLVRSLSYEDDVIISTMDFMKNENGNYYFDAVELEEANNKCQYIVEDAMERKTPCVFVYNAFTTPAEIDPYIELAERHKYIVHSMILECRHPRGNTRGVPGHIIQNMMKRFDICL